MESETVIERKTKLMGTFYRIQKYKNPGLLPMFFIEGFSKDHMKWINIGSITNRSDQERLKIFTEFCDKLD